MRLAKYFANDGSVGVVGRAHWPVRERASGSGTDQMSNTVPAEVGSRRSLLGVVGITALAVLVAGCGSTQAATPKGRAPSAITVGTLYAGSGAYSTASLPDLAGLKFWIQRENRKGGVYVGAYKKKIPVKLVAYDDQSSPTTAATLYSQLITQNKVNILVSDYGSVLTAPAVTIAAEHQQLLFNNDGTGASLFSPKNQYVVLTNSAEGILLPKALASYMLTKHVSKVAILYATNDYAQPLAQALNQDLVAVGVTPVYDQGIPPTTSTYESQIAAIKAVNPQAVVEVGFSTNDIAFLQALQATDSHFNMVFTTISVELPGLFESTVGKAGLNYTFGFGWPPTASYSRVNEGLTTAAFMKAFDPSNPTSVSYENVAGYQTGLVVETALGRAKILSQLGLRSALSAASGSLKTLVGTFKINGEGAQEGELLPIAQWLPSGSTVKPYVVYPASQATRAAVYPAP